MSQVRPLVMITVCVGVRVMDGDGAADLEAEKDVEGETLAENDVLVVTESDADADRDALGDGVEDRDAEKVILDVQEPDWDAEDVNVADGVALAVYVPVWLTVTEEVTDPLCEEDDVMDVVLDGDNEAVEDTEGEDDDDNEPEALDDTVAVLVRDAEREGEGDVEPHTNIS